MNGVEIKLCPICGTVWIFYDQYDRQQYRTNCECGRAWKNGAWRDTKKEAAEVWNKKAYVNIK